MGAQSQKIFTVAQALAMGTQDLSRAGIEGARLDAEVLLSLALGWKRERLYTQCRAPLDASEQEQYQSLLERRAHGEPSAYIAGRREFWSLDVLVTPAVLVPRPETETLVEIALKQIEATKKGCTVTGQTDNLRILELGTGSGAIAVSLARERSDITIWATDLSAAALEIARANAEQHGVDGRIHFLHGDTFTPVSEQQHFFHGIISNPPYVRRSELAKLFREVLREPRLALDGGTDGLELYRKIIPNSHLYLQDEGFMTLEIGADMGGELSQWFKDMGCYPEISVCKDYTGRDRVVVARKTASSGKPLGRD